MRSDSALPPLHRPRAEGRTAGSRSTFCTYEPPDGTRYEYDSASRKGPDAYRAELEANGRGETPRADAVWSCRRRATAGCVLIKRVPLSAEQLVHRVSRRPRSTPARILRRASTASCARRLDSPCGTTSTEPLEPLPQVGHSSARDSPTRPSRSAFAQVEKVADAAPEEAELIVPFEVAIERHPALPLREHDPHQHPCAAHPRRVRPAPRPQRIIPCGTPRTLPCHEKALPSSLDDRASHRWRSPIRGASSG